MLSKFFLKLIPAKRRNFHYSTFYKNSKVINLLLSVPIFKFILLYLTQLTGIRKSSILSKILLYQKIPSLNNKSEFYDIDFAHITKKGRVINTDTPFYFFVKKQTFSKIHLSIAILENFYYEYKNAEDVILKVVLLNNKTKIKKFYFQFPSNSKKHGICHYKKGNNWLNFELDITEFYELDIKIIIIPKINKNNFILIDKRNLDERKKKISKIQTNSIAITEPFLFNENKSDNNFLYLSFESLADILRLSRKNKFDLSRLKNLNSIISDSEIFSRCYTAVDSTLPHIASSLSGLIPSQHEIGDYSKDIFEETLNNKIITYAEVLKKNGYYTSGFTTYPRLDCLRGWNKGFCSWFNNERPFFNDAPSSTEICNEIFRLKNKKFFIFGHLDQLHVPLLSNYTNHGYNIDLKNSSQFLKRENYLNLYFDKLEYLDDQLGRIISYLKNLNLYNNTTIYITGDHGPALPPEWDVNERDYALYEFHTRVPLIIKHNKISSKVQDNQTPCNSQIKIYFDLLKKINVKIPDYFKEFDLFQIDEKYNKFAILETIKHPKKDRYSISLVDGNYKYWSYFKNFWNSKEETYIAEKKIFKIDQNGDAMENKNLIQDINSKELKYYENLVQNIIENNKKFRDCYNVNSFSLNKLKNKI